MNKDMTTCFSCDKGTYITKHGNFTVVPPITVPGGEITIHHATWRECDKCEDIIIPAKLRFALDAVMADRRKKVGD